MDTIALRDYRNWVGKAADEVLAAARRAGGWAAVFPATLPLWAHRVRNYFNQEPIALARYDADFSRAFLARIQEGLNALDRAKRTKWLKKHPLFGQLPEVRKLPEPPPGTPDLSLSDDVGETLALSDHVYKDHTGSTWYQMAPGGTIYHWGKDPVVPAVEAGMASAGGQAVIPIFKLVSPDGTGGSSETIIQNPQNRQLRVLGRSFKVGRFAIGEVSKWENVAHLIVTDSWHQGSYNYSETVDVGLAAHQKRDVAPHGKYAYPGVYVNPPNRFVPLVARRFPAKGADNERSLLAEQV